MSAGFMAARRELLAQAAVTHSGMSMPAAGPQAVAASTSPAAPPPVKLASYVTPLAIPPVIRAHGATPVQIQMRAFRHRAHRDIPATPMWGYNCMWPGPTFRRGAEASPSPGEVAEPTSHKTFSSARLHDSRRGKRCVPQVPHGDACHGARVMPESDGYPDAWVASDGHSGPVRAADPCHYPNDQAATTLWYHDHAMGITRLNIYAGLAGFYLIRDPEEDSLNLPSGPYRKFR